MEEIRGQGDEVLIRYHSNRTETLLQQEPSFHLWIAFDHGILDKLQFRLNSRLERQPITQPDQDKVNHLIK